MSKSLVAYFSASGVTAKVAAKLADALGADIFEIEPEVPYTKEDLNWMSKTSRSSVEMNDRSSRPAIKNTTDISQYDKIFVGFPVWWYREPSIIDTFLEAYDFTGKTLIPFATSGTSGLGDTASNFKALAPSATVHDGKRFGKIGLDSSIKKFAEEYI